jgi:hypothetical protein
LRLPPLYAEHAHTPYPFRLGHLSATPPCPRRRGTGSDARRRSATRPGPRPRAAGRKRRVTTTCTVGRRVFLPQLVSGRAFLPAARRQQEYPAMRRASLAGNDGRRRGGRLQAGPARQRYGGGSHRSLRSRGHTRPWARRRRCRPRPRPHALMRERAGAKAGGARPYPFFGYATQRPDASTRQPSIAATGSRDRSRLQRPERRRPTRRTGRRVFPCARA